jgi:uroporphyrinogen-III decarboxylase
MTSQERLRAVFTHQAPDRVPIWLLFPYESEPIAADVYSEPSYRDVARRAREQTDFIERNTLNMEYLGSRPGSSVVDFLFHHPEVHKSTEVAEAGGARTMAETVRWGENTVLRKAVVQEAGRSHVEPYLGRLDDLERIVGLPYDIPEVDMVPFRRKAERLGHHGLHGILIIDPISVFHDLCSETDFLVWAFTETARVRRFLDLVARRMLAIYEQFLKGGVGETFFMSGPEYLVPPLGTLPLFRELVVSYDREIIELVRSYGKRTILHCHGRVGSVLEEIAAMAPDALQPVEPPPVGDCSLAQARQALGQNTVLIGNIEYSDLAAREPWEIEEFVARAIEEGGRRAFILGPSCSPYETQISPRTAENYIAMIEAGLKYGAASAQPEEGSRRSARTP